MRELEVDMAAVDVCWRVDRRIGSGLRIDFIEECACCLLQHCSWFGAGKKRENAKILLPSSQRSPSFQLALNDVNSRSR